MATQWGRKETIVWPPQSPIHSYGALLGAVFLTGVWIWMHFAFAASPLQQFYTPTYFRTAIGSAFDKQDTYRLLYVGNGRGQGQLAHDVDVIAGTTATPDGKALPLTLSTAAHTRGMQALYRGPSLKYKDGPLHAFLASAVYDGEGLQAAYSVPLYVGLATFAVLLCFSIPADVKRRKRLKYGRRLKGPVMLTPREFNETLNGTGLGITTSEQDTILRIPKPAESHHIQIQGDTGVGKSTLIYQILRQIEDRGEAAIVHDPSGEFIQRFLRPDRGDVVLNPMDERCPYWSPSDELTTPAEARTIAASLYQPNDKNKSEFFTQTPQKVFARLLQYRPTPRQLAEWMANEEEIDKRVEGTPIKSMIAQGAHSQRSGVLGSLGLVADGLLLLPTPEQGNGTWSATEWAKTRKGWIFLTGKKSEREAIRPLHSLWIDLLILRLGETPEPGQKRAWFVLDEIASLQRLPQFHTALTEGRKSDNPILFAYQGKGQVEEIYDVKMAEVLLSQAGTKFILRTAEPNAAKWASELIGEVEIERVRETVADGKRSGKSFTMDRQIEPLVMSSEIKGLPDLHAFVKLENYVSRFVFPHMSLPLIAQKFVPRPNAQDGLWLEIPPSSSLPQSAVLPPDPEESPRSKRPRTPRPRKSIETAPPVPQPTSPASMPIKEEPEPDSVSGPEAM